jgi:hypothetical protein
VFLDDQPLGAAPRRIEARAGAHVLRVEAEGREPYVARIDLLPGVRPSVSIALAPTRVVGALAALDRHVARGDLDAVGVEVASLDASLGRSVVAWYVEAGEGPLDRALATPCDRSGCRAPARLEPGTLTSPRGALDGGMLDAHAQRVAIAWRDEPLPIETPPPPSDAWSEAWPWVLVGTGAVLVIGGLITGIVLATEPPPQQHLVFDVMPPH